MTKQLARLFLYLGAAFAGYSILTTYTEMGYWQLSAWVLFFTVLVLAPDQPDSKILSRVTGLALCALTVFGVTANVNDYQIVQNQEHWEIKKLPTPSWEDLLANSDAKSYTATLTDALCIADLIEAATIQMQRRSNKLSSNITTIARLKPALTEQLEEPTVTNQSKQCGAITVLYSDPPSKFYAFSEKLMTLYPISENNND